MQSIGKLTIRYSKALAKKTSLGKKLSNIRQEALIAKNNNLEVETISIKDTVKAISKNVQGKKIKIGLELVQNKKYMKALIVYMRQTSKNFLTLLRMNPQNLFKVMVETGGVGPNKFLQIISSDEKLLAQVPSFFKKTILGSRSNNTATRTLQQVNKELIAKFNGKYTTIEKMGVGTVAEAYLIKDNTGKERVAKFIKKGINEKLLDAEEIIFTTLLKKIIKDPKQAQQKVERLQNLYKGWKIELNFVQEAKYNKLLAQKAKRFNVAKITELSQDAQIIIYEKAEGIQADKFIHLVEEFKQNPKEYLKKYKNLLLEHPWMNDPEQVLKGFTSNFIKSFNEMLLFSKKGMSIMHCDPHTGNMFVNPPDAKGKIKTTFIDTGNCCIRTSKDIAADLKFFLNYFIGNSKEVAKYFIGHAQSLPKNKNTEQIVNELSSQMDKKLFKNGYNITNIKDNQKVIDRILDDMNIFLSPKTTTALKAQAQAMNNIQAFYNLSGTPQSQIIYKILPDAIKGMIKLSNIENPYNMVKSAIGHMIKETNTSLKTLFQFTS